jgi:hypothetical protein
VARRRVIVGIGILVVLGVALFLLFGGKDSPLEAINPFPARRLTDLRVHARRRPQATVAARTDAQNKTSDEVAPGRRPRHQAVQAGYADPSSATRVRSRPFTDEAQKQIDANIGVLTPVPTPGTPTRACSQHEQPARGHSDRREGRRAARAAEPEFTAIATHTDGTY